MSVLDEKGSAQISNQNNKGRGSPINIEVLQALRDFFEVCSVRAVLLQLRYLGRVGLLLFDWEDT